MSDQKLAGETPDRATLAARLRAFAGWIHVLSAISEESITDVRQAADALAATCATCRFAGVASNGTRECYAPEWVTLGHEVTTVPAVFYCRFHEPVPAPATGETEREG